MEKVKYRYNRWRLALGRLVNLRYINRWIIFCADLFISLCVSLIGVLGLLSIMHVYISGISVLKVGIASFVASILSFLTFKVYPSFHATWTMEDWWCRHHKIHPHVHTASSFEGEFQFLYILGGRDNRLYVDDCSADHLTCIRD